ALSSARSHLPLSVSLYVILAGETGMFLRGFQPGSSSVFSPRELLRRHCLADVFLAFLDLLKHPGCLFFREQVPHVSGNGSRLKARVLSIFTVRNIFDLRKMLSQPKLGTGIAGLGGFDDPGEWRAVFVGIVLRLGLRVVHGEIEQLGAAGDA